MCLKRNGLQDLRKYKFEDYIHDRLYPAPYIDSNAFRDETCAKMSYSPNTTDPCRNFQNSMLDNQQYNFENCKNYTQSNDCNTFKDQTCSQMSYGCPTITDPCCNYESRQYCSALPVADTSCCNASDYNATNSQNPNDSYYRDSIFDPSLDCCNSTFAGDQMRNLNMQAVDQFPNAFDSNRVNFWSCPPQMPTSFNGCPTENFDEICNGDFGEAQMSDNAENGHGNAYCNTPHGELNSNHPLFSGLYQPPPTLPYGGLNYSPLTQNPQVYHIHPYNCEPSNCKCQPYKNCCNNCECERDWMPTYIIDGREQQSIALSCSNEQLKNDIQDTPICLQPLDTEVKSNLNHPNPGQQPILVNI